jgi:signal transduction histidine kinase
MTGSLPSVAKAALPCAVRDATRPGDDRSRRRTTHAAAAGRHLVRLSPDRSPLAGAALVFVRRGATVEELESLFAAAGADLRPGAAQDLLTGLESLGLVHVARRGRSRRYVRSSLGRRFVDQDVWRVASGALKDLEDLRSDVLSVTMHELRTPITVIRTLAGLLLDPSSDPTDEQRRTMLLTMERNAERMQHLLHQILDLARYRSGTIDLQVRRFDPIEVCRSVVATIQPLADGRDQVVEFHVTGDPPDGVCGDRPRVEQALLNLLANAHHFAPTAGHITLDLDGPTDGMIRWSVKDDGPGIRADDQTRLFERFFVKRPPGNAAHDGVGLGLPTALAIAEAHGGSIDVASRLGHGSTFTLRIPVAGPSMEA